MLQLSTAKQYREIASRNKKYYHSGRWVYTSAILRFLNKLKIEKALELGSYKFSYYQDSDLMDMKQHEGIRPVKFLQPAQQLPWDIPDKHYDIFIATNVWEHLEGKQREVFAEVKRTCKSALLSIPYKWKNHRTRSHIGIGMKTILNWCLDIEPTKFFQSWKVMVCYWEFEDDKNT